MQHKRSCVKNSPNLLLASKIKASANTLWYLLRLLCSLLLVWGFTKKSVKALIPFLFAWVIHSYILIIAITQHYTDTIAFVIVLWIVPFFLYSLHCLYFICKRTTCC